MSRDLLRFLGGFTGRLGVLALLIVAQSSLSVLPILVGQRLIDEGVMAGDPGRVWGFGLAFAGAAALHAVLVFAERGFAVRLGEDMVLRLRLDLYTHLQRQSLGFFTAARAGAIVSRLHGDVTGVQRVVSSTIPAVVGAVVSLIVAGVALLAMEPRLALALGVVMPVVYGATTWVSRRLKSVSRRYLSANADLDSKVAERFSVVGAETASLYVHPDRDRDVFRHNVVTIRNLVVRQALLGAGLSAFLTLAIGMAGAGAYVFSGLWVISGTVSFGMMVAMVALLARLYNPIVTLAGVKVDLVTGLVSFGRVREILDFAPRICDAPDALELPRTGGACVEFSKVSFEYPASMDLVVPSLAGELAAMEAPRGPVLGDFSLTIEPGMTVGLVGPSGSGKSTLARLLVRSWDVGSGRILIDGVDLRKIRLASLRNSVGVVTQTPFLFNGTIRANLLMAAPEADQEHLIEACRAAQIWGMIEAAPDGLDTMVGDGGMQVSGGERQRLAIARLLLTDPRIVILDEATSHLDNATEQAVQRALTPFMKGRTCLVIAHRLATVRDAQLIVVMHEGRVVEQGSHAHLDGMGGFYARLSRTHKETA
ncbi:ABC transporter ATP-binding protein [Nonomuraea sp. K274]|uniref:ABC transporter ATP-binding protein n=1 Tax=Nonomuraea cypriaca TaxID=1187855 RepID=A0A931A7S1_9ACTN|nr:ABC transporter ATP-binding protein [Nonomuraea cypriaca]MBF8184945.1 ABC transporter ATP-binding protein [Nonomuraea cypriaca]